MIRRSARFLLVADSRTPKLLRPPPKSTSEKSQQNAAYTKEPKTLKILLVNKFYFPLGGPETYLFQLERLFREKGHSVVVFSTKDARNRKCPQSPFFVEKIDYNRSDLPLRQRVKFGLRLLYSFDAARKMDALLRKERPDIAHLHNICHQISPSILPVLKRRGVPAVQTLHDLKRVCPNYMMLSGSGICERCKGGAYHNTILQRCVKGSLGFSALNCAEAYLHGAIRVYDSIELYIAPSRFYKRKLVSFGLSAESIRAMPYCISLDQTPSQSSKGYILHCGRLAKHKGVFTLVKAVEGCGTLKLVLAGSGPEEETLRRYLREKRVRNVELPGFVTGKVKARLMREASLVVLASEWYENCPLVIMEAFAYGKPVVAARIGGIPEQVRDGFNGLLFEPGNVSELRERIQYLFSKPHEIARMGRNARKTAEELYAPDHHYQQLMSVYDEAITRHRQRAVRKSMPA